MRKPSPTALSAIINEEMEAAYYEIGRRIFTIFVDQALESRAQIDPRQVRPVVEEVIRKFGADPERNPLTKARQQPADRTKQVLELAEREVRACSDYAGVWLSDICGRIETDLGHRITTESLRQILRRTPDHHVLVVRRGKVRLKADLLVEYIAKNHGIHRIRLTERPVSSEPSRRVN